MSSSLKSIQLYFFGIQPVCALTLYFIRNEILRALILCIVCVWPLNIFLSFHNSLHFVRLTPSSAVDVELKTMLLARIFQLLLYLLGPRFTRFLCYRNIIIARKFIASRTIDICLLEHSAWNYKQVYKCFSSKEFLKHKLNVVYMVHMRFDSLVSNLHAEHIIIYEIWGVVNASTKNGCATSDKAH